MNIQIWRACASKVAKAPKIRLLFVSIDDDNNNRGDDSDKTRTATGMVITIII